MTKPSKPLRKPAGSPKRLKSGGRQNGSRNLKTERVVSEVARSLEDTPLDFLLRVMRNALEPMWMRLDAAKAAAPYVHPKLAQIDHTTSGGNVIVIKGGLPLEEHSETKPTLN